MPTANGASIAPTGKAFKIAMCTVGHWKDGVMDEEYLFWDNATYAKQIGLAGWRRAGAVGSRGLRTWKFAALDGPRRQP